MSLTNFNYKYLPIYNNNIYFNNLFKNTNIVIDFKY